MNPKTKKALNIVSYVLIGIIFLVALMVLMMSLTQKADNDIPKLFGTSVLIVKSDSMKKTPEGVAKAEEDLASGLDPSKRVYFNKGDLILLKRLTPDEKKKLAIGDVITYYDLTKEIFNTHRIVDTYESQGIVQYITRGVGLDADGKQIPQDETGNDPFIDSSMVQGVYTGKLAGMGAVMGFFQSKLGFGLLIVLPLFAFLAYRIYIVVRLMVAINKEKRQGTTLSEMEKMQAEIEKLKAELKGEKPADKGAREGPADQ